MLFLIALIATAQGLDVSKAELAFDLQSAEGQVKVFNQLLQSEGIDYEQGEKRVRFRKFRQSLKEVVKMNAEQDSYETTVNFMSTLTEEEKEQHYGINVTAYPVGDWDAPAGQGSQGLQGFSGSANWRTRGAVTAVKNQKSCGSCWTFAGIAAFEGHYKIKAGALKRFSEQEFLDCTNSDGRGCKGGWYWNAFDRVLARHQHLATSTSYPYTAKHGRCRRSSTRNGMTHAKCTGSYKVRRGSDAALAQALNQGPVAIAFEIKGGFNQYKSGILRVTGCGATPHHAMAVVGYTSTYWDIKNSWGPNWGDQGFIKFDRRVNNMCGVSNWAAYPKLTKTGNDSSKDDTSGGNSGGGSSCTDKAKDCRSWAYKGYCKKKYVSYMQKTCRKACGFCSGSSGKCASGLKYCGGKCQHEHFCHGE